MMHGSGEAWWWFGHVRNEEVRSAWIRKVIPRWWLLLLEVTTWIHIISRLRMLLIMRPLAIHVLMVTRHCYSVGHQRWYVLLLMLKHVLLLGLLGHNLLLQVLRLFLQLHNLLASMLDKYMMLFLIAEA